MNALKHALLSKAMDPHTLYSKQTCNAQVAKGINHLNKSVVIDGSSDISLYYIRLQAEIVNGESSTPAQ